MIIEKRKHRRMDISSEPEEFFNIKTNNVLSRKGLLKNISEGGAAISTKGNFNVGDEIFVRFKISDNKDKVDTLGRVVRYDDSVLGVKFLKIGSNSRTDIADYVKTKTGEKLLVAALNS